MQKQKRKIANERKKERFVLKLPLKTQRFQEDIIDKRLEISRRLYNQLVAKTKNDYNEMIKTKRYRNIREELSQIYDSKTEEEKSSKKRSKNFVKAVWFRRGI